MVLRRLLQFLSLISPWGFAHRTLEVAEAFETPALNQIARRHSVLSLTMLVVGSTLLFVAAITNNFSNGRITSERVGACGVVCLIICVYQGLRYKEANGVSQKVKLEDDERMT